MGELVGQGWLQVGELALAFVLSGLIGLEREIRQKSAGLRTYTLVGFGAALIMLVSKFGFNDVLSPSRVELDPSRVAAQIVTGIGFIGGGLIFVRGDMVRGLTTAASVWITAAIGMACGAGLPILALVVTAGNFIVVLVFPSVVNALPTSRWSPRRLQVSYEDGRGVLREVMTECTHFDFSINRLTVDRRPHFGDAAVDESDDIRLLLKQDSSELHPGEAPAEKVVTISFELIGRDSITELITRVEAINGVVSVSETGSGGIID